MLIKVICARIAFFALLLTFLVFILTNCGVALDASLKVLITILAIKAVAAPVWTLEHAHIRDFFLALDTSGQWLD